MFEKLKNIEEMKFKNFQTSEEVGELREYITQWFIKNPDGKIAIGTDSQRKKKYLIYVTVIALFYPYNKGAHLIYFRTRFKVRKIDLWSRLWEEVELTRLIGEHIKPIIGNRELEVHVDLNPDANYESNKLLNAAVGYLKAFDFVVIAKPDGCIASTAADWLTD